MNNEETFDVVIDNMHITAYKNVHGHDLEPGDMYIAKRNTGWRLGKCRLVDHKNGWVVADPPLTLYSYNCNECYKVKSMRYEQELTI